MRKKKLANKIVSILMAAMMVVSSPMSALAVDTYTAENEAVVLQAETVTEEETQDSADMQEDMTDEDITVDDAELLTTGGAGSELEESEVLLGEEAEQTAEKIAVQADDGASDTPVSSGYQIQVTECTHGTVTPSVEQAEQGETVTLTVKPWGGYSLKSLKAVYTQDGAEKELELSEEHTFTMPDAEVTVTAEFEQTAWLTTVKFSSVWDGSTEPENAVNVELKDGVTEYDVNANNYDYENKAYMYLSTNKDIYTTVNKPTATTYKATDYIRDTWRTVTSYMNDGVTKLWVKLTDTKQSYGANYEKLNAAEYSFNIVRKASLKSMTLEGIMTPVTFNRAVYEYQTTVSHDAQTIALTAGGYKDRYMISAADQTVNSGETIKVPLKWDEQDQMTIPVVVSGDDVQSTTYTLQVTRETEEDVPTIRKQPVGGQKYVVPITAEETTALSTSATGNGQLTYQWYKNTVSSTENATLIEGATESSYHPVFGENEQGRYYYYCTVTNTNDKGSFTNNTEIVPVTAVLDPTPSNVKIVYADGSEIGPEGLKLNVRESVALGVQYDTKADKELLDGSVEITFGYTDDHGNEAFSSQMNVWSIKPKHGYMHCTVIITINGKKYLASSIGEEEKGIEFTVCAIEARQATINAQGKDMEYVVGGEDMQPLSIGLSYSMSAYSLSGTGFSTDDQVVNSWQWMVSEDGTYFAAIDNDSARGISEQPSGMSHTVSYVPEPSDVACKRYYKCRFTTSVDSYNGNTYRAYTDSDVIEVTFSEVQGFEGEGTAASPYLIQNVEDLNLLAEYVNKKGLNFSGKILKLTTDLTIPEGWTQIGTEKGGDTAQGKNLLPFSGTFDGDGHTITIPAGGKTVFNRVREAKINNLNIYGTQITGYGLVDGYTIDYGPDGDYNSGVPKSVTIRNCKLLSGSKTLKSGLIGGGASGKNEILIQNCEVEAGVVIGYDKTQSNIGSIAGLFNGTIQNCRSYAEVYGVDNVGGIMGSKCQSMGPCRIISCHFGGTVTATGKFAGGIAGNGYDNQTAPNSPCVTLQYNSCDGIISGADNVGGIFGGEGGVLQCWGNGIGYIQNNQFTGTLIAPEGANVGGIIGYMRSIDRYNVIENNYWKTGCGATSGIGKIESIDTTSKDYGVEKDFVVDEVCIPSSAEEMPDITKAVVTDLILEGEYKTTYYLGEELDLTGMVLTAQYSNGTETHPALSEATVSGYDKNKHGEQTVTVKYGDAVVTFVVLVLKKSNDTITVSFTLLGDKVHDASQDGEIHTLKSGNLTTWAAEKNYEVDQNANVKEVLEKVLEENHMTCSNPTGNYVESITNGDITLGEFDNGVRTSGWMYTLNGTYPDLGVKQQYLNDGDVIIFHFTDDYNLEHQHRWKNEWSYDETGHWHACDDWCPITDNTQKDGYGLHTASDWIVDNAETGAKHKECTVCGYIMETASNHTCSWDVSRITKAPTCTENGVKTWYCGCGATKTEMLPATGHAYGKWTITTEATVFTPDVQTRTCTVCGNKETRKSGSALNPTIKVNATTVPLKVKQKTSAFMVTGLAKGDSIQSYKSSNTKIFTVTKSGVLKAGKKTGKATLTITLASGLQKKVTVKVQKKTVTTSKITGLQKKVTLKKGAKLTLKPSLTPITSTQKFTYKSSNKKIATVNSKGVITAKKAGKTKITVKSGSKKYTVTVTVTK